MHIQNVKHKKHVFKHIFRRFYSGNYSLLCRVINNNYMISEKSKQIISSVSEEFSVPTAALHSVHFAGVMDGKAELQPKPKEAICEHCGEFIYDDEELCLCGKENPIYKTPVQHKDPTYITSDELYNLNGFGSEEECNKQFFGGA